MLRDEAFSRHLVQDCDAQACMIDSPDATTHLHRFPTSELICLEFLDTDTTALVPEAGRVLHRSWLVAIHDPSIPPRRAHWTVVVAAAFRSERSDACFSSLSIHVGQSLEAPCRA